jgi:hypothetical protein
VRSGVRSGIAVSSAARHGEAAGDCASTRPVALASLVLRTKRRGTLEVQRWEPHLLAEVWTVTKSGDHLVNERQVAETGCVRGSLIQLPGSSIKYRFGLQTGVPTVALAKYWHDLRLWFHVTVVTDRAVRLTSFESSL